MESKVLKVFYGNDLLPYKDSERQVHFPVGGNAFAGSSYTNSIRFYVDRIGGTSGITWVVVSKLPNGKLGYEILTSVATDSDLGVDYLNFTLSSYYTQYKGIVQLALRGYNGEITFTQNDQGVYVIQGTPIIEVTGTISLAINYSPMVVTGNELLPTEVDQILAAMSGYVPLENGFVVLASTPSADDLAQYDEGQLFYIKSDKTFYKLESGSLVYYDLGISVIELSGTSGTLSDNDFANLTSGKGLILRDEHIYYFNMKGTYNGNTYWNFKYTNNSTYMGVINFDRKQIAIQEDKTWSYGANDFTSYTQNKIDSMFADLGSVLSYQGTKTVAEINDLNTALLKVGYVYNVSDSGTITLGSVVVLAGDNVAWNGTGWDKLAGTVDLSGYLQKSSSANKVYGTDGLGNQTLYTVDDFYDGNIARRDSDGSITVPLTPSSNGEASSKKYVDDTIRTELTSALEDYAKVDGYYPTMSVGSADNIASTRVIDDESGACPPIIFGITGGEAEIQTGFSNFEELHGQSFVFNQLCDNAVSSSSNNGITLTNNGNGTYTFSGTASAQTEFSLNTYNHRLFTIVGHKYLLCAFGLTGQSDSTYDVRVNGIERISTNGVNYKIATCTTTENYVTLMVRNGAVISTPITFKVQLFDLTQMGLDSITNANDFFNLFPKPYYAYTTGTLISSKSTSLVSYNINQFDGNTEIGWINNVNGNLVYDKTCFRSTNYIKVIAGQDYLVHTTLENYLQMYIYWYDDDKNYLGMYSTTTFAQDRIVTIPSDTHYIKISYKKSATTDFEIEGLPNVDIAELMTRVWFGAEDSTSVPYKAQEKQTITLPNIELKSAGSAYDITYSSGGGERRIGVVDLGTLEWSYNSSPESHVFRVDTSLIDNIKLVSNLTIVGNILCPKYITQDMDRMTAGVGGFIAVGSSSFPRLVITDNNYSDASAFKTAMSGVYLYYELATPTIISNTENAGWNERVVVDNYGTLEFTSNETIQCPQAYYVKYTVSLTEFLDSAYAYTSGSIQNIALISDINTEATNRSTQDTILQNAIGGTLRQCLCVKESLDFDNTNVVDLGSLNWTSDGNNIFHSDPIADLKQPASTSTVIKAICTKYKAYSQVDFNNSSLDKAFGGLNWSAAIEIKDTAYSDTTTLKASLKGVLVAYEKA